MRTSNIYIPVDTLLYRFESGRVEFKAAWDEKTTGEQVIKTICAFANDFQNLSGGYILIGVAEKNGRALLPPLGLNIEALTQAKNWLINQCKTIEPIYTPIFSEETYEGKHLLVIWCPPSEIRPHYSRKFQEKGAEKTAYIRIDNQTIDVKNKPEYVRQLNDLSARTPFDNRTDYTKTIDVLSDTKVRQHLSAIKSSLISEADTRQIYRNMRISTQVNGHDSPKNVALLCFTQNPEDYFEGARIEATEFPSGQAGDLLEDRVFGKSPIQEQLASALSWLESKIKKITLKFEDQINAKIFYTYPIIALREALVNAIYHRSYDKDVPYPVKIYIYNKRIEIISYPGPYLGFKDAYDNREKKAFVFPARNNRIGEVLKELGFAEARNTGFSKIKASMRDNGSPEPIFDFQEGQLGWFRVIFPIFDELLFLNTINTYNIEDHMQVMLDKLRNPN
jgi:ATP-dependent DNA helicase RecG